MISTINPCVGSCWGSLFASFCVPGSCCSLTFSYKDRIAMLQPFPPRHS